MGKERKNIDTSNDEKMIRIVAVVVIIPGTAVSRINKKNKSIIEQTPLLSSLLPFTSLHPLSPDYGLVPAPTYTRQFPHQPRTIPKEKTAQSIKENKKKETPITTLLQPYTNSFFFIPLRLDKPVRQTQH